MIALVDYGCGNIGSIVNMLKKCGVDKVAIISDPCELRKASKIILPGVGSFDYGMKMLCKLGFDEAIKEYAVSGGAMMGICLGMQLLTKSSEEGFLPGLGLVNAETLSFKRKNDFSLKIPHMGWNVVRQMKTSKYIGRPDEREER